ncbi:hypothetical protein CDL15_Pgr004065 [Punica granatum]|uniref:Uncharacterized protein n=1 Tax=Punica granatum TaxID=22663 RepID=A0A218XFY9_PUNGR|nr:hypothetical protein CDL15_Pgr004065 [Punica granatum]
MARAVQSVFNRASIENRELTNYVRDSDWRAVKDGGASEHERDHRDGVGSRMCFSLQRVWEGHDRRGKITMAPASRWGGIAVAPGVVEGSRSSPSRLSRL